MTPDSATRRRASVLLLVLGQSTQTLLLGGLGLFLPLIRRDLGVSYAQAGALAATATLTYAACQLPSGYLSDRLGARRLFLAGLVGSNTFTLVFTRAATYPQALLAQIGSGLFRGLVFAPGMLLITGLFSRDRRATAMGLFVAGGLTTNVALNLVGPLLIGRLGWRGVLTLAAAVGLTVSALVWAVVPDRSSPGRSVSLRRLPELLRQRTLRWLGVIQFVRLGVQHGLTVWLPTYLVLNKGFTLTHAGLLLGVATVLTAPANLVGGYLSDRSRRPMAIIIASLAILSTSLALTVVADRPAVLAPLVALSMVATQLYFGPLFALPLHLVEPGAAGTATGLANLWANLGGFCSVLALGLVRDATGSLDAGLLVLALLAALGLATAAGLRHRLPAPDRASTVPV